MSDRPARRNTSERFTKSWTPACFILLGVLAACGSNPSSPGDGNDSLPQPPNASPAPEPPVTQPSRTPAPLQQIEAMQLGDEGRATGVNEQEWIALVAESRSAAIGFNGWMSLPPDADPELPPPPELPCRATLDAAEPGACFHEFDMPLNVVNDRILGVRVFFGSGGPFLPFPYLFSANAEEIPLLPAPSGDPLLFPDLLTMVLGQGRGLAGSIARIPITDFAGKPLYWSAPSPEALGQLPSEGFTRGPRPTGMDASERIAAAGLEPALPVIYLPGEDGYTLQVLPLLDGGERGAALAIDDGRLVGWSDDADGHQHATMWSRDGEEFTASTLPVPDFAVGCDSATAIEANRVAGECLDGNGNRIAVLWHVEPQGAVEAILEPLRGTPTDGAAHVTAMAGSLAVGWSGSSEETVPAAWRLPPRSP